MIQCDYFSDDRVDRMYYCLLAIDSACMLRKDVGHQISTSKNVEKQRQVRAKEQWLQMEFSQDAIAISFGSGPFEINQNMLPSFSIIDHSLKTFFQSQDIDWA